MADRYVEVHCVLFDYDVPDVMNGAKTSRSYRASRELSITTDGVQMIMCNVKTGGLRCVPFHRVNWYDPQSAATKARSNSTYDPNRTVSNPAKLAEDSDEPEEP